MKSLLVAGDYGIINEYLIALYNFEMNQTGESNLAELNQTLSVRNQEGGGGNYLTSI